MGWAKSLDPLIVQVDTLLRVYCKKVKSGFWSALQQETPNLHDMRLFPTPKTLNPLHAVATATVCNLYANTPRRPGLNPKARGGY